MSTTSTITEEDETTVSSQTQAASRRLRETMTAVRLGFMWLGVRKTLSPVQRDQAAGSFGAEGKYLLAGKKLLDTNHPNFKAVTKVKGRATAYWIDQTLPYPEPGLRLIRQQDVAEFGRQVDLFRVELDEAVGQLEQHYADLRSAAGERLGELFNADDYPPTLIGAFGIDCDFPNVDPPEYLRQLSPALYEAECSRVQARFNQAVELAEQAFLDELAKLVDHLAIRLSGDEDGRPRVFRDTAVTNLNDFLERFQRLNIRSNDQLDELVTRARGVIDGVEPGQLRKQPELRQHVSTQMASIQSSLDQLLVDRPRRRIQRRPR